MKTDIKANFTIFSGIMLLLTGSLFSQSNLKKEIMVVKPYEPVISDAFKISELPEINDSSKSEFNFKYLFNSSPSEVNFEPQLIKPANMAGEPIQSLYNVLVTAGMGNYITPFASITYNTERSKKYSVSANAGHISSFGKTANDASKKVFAGYMNNEASISARKYLKLKTLSANAGFNHHIAYYNGYNTARIFDDSVLPLSINSTQNREIISFTSKVKLKTDPIDSTQVNYLIGAEYKYTDAAYKITENDVRVNTSMNYFFEKEFIGFDASVSYFDLNGLKDTLNTAVVEFSPWVGVYNKKWQVKVGLNTFYDDARSDESEIRFRPYPKIHVHYNVIEYFLIPYFEFSGQLISNPYSKILAENYFIKPDLTVKPTDKRYEMCLGIRGNISSRIGFIAYLSNAQYYNQYFFVNDTSFMLHNRFNVVYDDIKLIRGNIELSYKKSEKLNFLLTAHYYSYTMKKEEKPWHCPDFDVTFTGRFQLQNKLVLTTDVTGTGTRYVKILQPAGYNIEKLRGTALVNMGIEYRYTRLLSAFIKVNNIAGAKYYQWNYYPSQRLTVLAGISYIL